MTPSLPSKHSRSLSCREQRVSDRRFLLSPNNDVLPCSSCHSLLSAATEKQFSRTCRSSREEGVQKESLKRMHPSLLSASSSEKQKHCPENSN
ncbi:hypothetical protein CEXT_589581 [Caerostris extrusa]|uniref:Uncharacterized protein n=1 Tax=Caerostris extrusa TaxID=172846 RepID=A0AAV4QBK0_CAEEX|nr:hypothetical protein CEXT_589581 [Caerostris extrusa]